MVEQKKFNKGITALEATGLGLLAFIFVAYTHSFILACICGFYAYKTKMVPTYYKKSGAWGYASLIWLLPVLGIPYFFYDVLKNKAIKEKQNIDTPKGVLFWICTSFWVLLFFFGLYVVFISIKN